ncbi:MAG: hypothetical protein KZQ58_08580 [gamma proteobacterium symbiont of Bathyaustriella thionipta]|nr:hypothetical protein [gamma proteobacterium symbiont of Bathyaustriella thionipta]
MNADLILGILSGTGFGLSLIPVLRLSGVIVERFRLSVIAEWFLGLSLFVFFLALGVGVFLLLMNAANNILDYRQGWGAGIFIGLLLYIVLIKLNAVGNKSGR